jgi:hypothetical protein
MGTVSCKEACGSEVRSNGETHLKPNHPTGSPVVASGYVPRRKAGARRFTVLLEGPLLVSKKKRTIDANSTGELVAKAIEAANLEGRLGIIEVFDPQFSVWVEPCFEELQGGLLRMRILAETAAPGGIEKNLKRTQSVLAEISALKKEVTLERQKQSLAPKPRGRSSSVIEEVAMLKQCASEYELEVEVLVPEEGDEDAELTAEQAVEIMIIPLNGLSASKLRKSVSLLNFFFNKTPWGAGDAGSAADENRKRKHVIKTTVTTPVAVKNVASFLKHVCTPQNVPQLLARFEMTASAFGVLNHIADASGPTRAIIFSTILQEGLLDSLVGHIAAWRVKGLTAREKPLAEEITEMSLKVLMKLTRQEARIDRVLANEFHRAWDDDDDEGI